MTARSTFSAWSGHVLLAGAIVTAIPGAARAISIPISNHSFELPVAAPGIFITNAPPTGWAAYGDSLDFLERTIGVLNPNGTGLYLDPVPDGDNVGVTFLFPQMGDESGLQQTLGATLETFTQYTLTVEVGNLANDGTPYDFDGFPGYRIDLLAGTTVIASDDNTLLPDEGRFLTSTIQVSIGVSHANAGEPLSIRLVNLDSAPGIEVNFDDVRLDAVSTIECPTVLPLGCKTATPTKGVLSLSRKPGDLAKNNLGWTWKGEQTLLDELGDPTTSSSYRFCAYDGNDQVILALVATAAADCGTKPCWKGSSKGFSYKDRLGVAGGLTDLKLKEGADGKASLKLKAKGAGLSFPVLPLVQLPGPVRALLLNEETNACWTAVFSSAPSDPDSTVKWRVKND
jgi:hypothetical protein